MLAAERVGSSQAVAISTPDSRTVARASNVLPQMSIDKIWQEIE